MMRHLVEVMMVLEGRQPWARALRDRRGEEGLPLPSVQFGKMRRIIRSGDSVVRGLMVSLGEGVDSEIMRMVVSFL